MGQFAKDTIAGALLWKAAIARAMLHMLMPLMGTFIALSAAISYDQWQAMWWMKKWAFWVGIIWNSGSSLLAFLDKTVENLKGEIDSK